MQSGVNLRRFRRKPLL